MKKFLSLLFVLTGLSPGYSQHIKSDILDHLNAYNFNAADSLLKSMPSSEEKLYLKWQLQFMSRGVEGISTIDSIAKEDSLDIHSLIKAGDIAFKKEKNDLIAFEYYRNAFENAEDRKDSSLAKFTLYKINNLLFTNPELSNLLNHYLTKFQTYSATANDLAYYDYYYYTIKSFKEQKEQIASHKNTLIKTENAAIPYIRGKTKQMIGNQFGYYLKNQDSSIYYDKLAIEDFKTIKGVPGSSGLFVSYNNLGVSNNELGNYEEAISYFNQARKYLDDDLQKKSYLNLALAQAYKKAKIYDSAYYYLEEHRKLVEELKDHESAIALEDIETKYQTAEKEKQILLEKRDKERNQNIAIGLGGGLAAVTIIGFLVYKNSKRKQHIAEQQRELEISKTEKILKEQELTTIDAMLEGQEKERQRLAGDLHDSVGATLAAARLQFTHLSDNKNKAESMEDLYYKTGKLLDDAYNEVRSMAHIKNSGVLAKDGLLPAVEKLAKNASVNGKIQIDVNHFGLEDRIENNLEITVFRIIQELVTNIIKHAHASEVNISITQHETDLNIIVEDNGVGFKPLAIQKKDGMGLSSIEKRVEHMEGSMEVDSTPGKGTNILIDIPL